jgi:hypothetical protein
LSRRGKVSDVPLARDEGWWLHPAFRGGQTLPLEGTGLGKLPHRWVRSDAPAASGEAGIDDHHAYADLAKILYALNGHRPGPVAGFYVIVEASPGHFAVGQLCADPVVPVQLFEDLVYEDETLARAKAAELKAAQPGPQRR